jgi:hypothetical protein
MDAYGAPVNSLIFEKRVLLSQLLSLLNFAAENRETPMPSAFRPEVSNFEAENLPNPLYPSLLAGNSDSLRFQVFDGWSGESRGVMF